MWAANQSARKTLSTVLVYTKKDYHAFPPRIYSSCCNAARRTSQEKMMTVIQRGGVMAKRPVWLPWCWFCLDFGTILKLRYWHFVATYFSDVNSKIWCDVLSRLTRHLGFCGKFSLQSRKRFSVIYTPGSLINCVFNPLSVFTLSEPAKRAWIWPGRPKKITKIAVLGPHNISR